MIFDLFAFSFAAGVALGMVAMHALRSWVDGRGADYPPPEPYDWSTEPAERLWPQGHVREHRHVWLVPNEKGGKSD
jgi:hypothetical protein